MKLCELLRLRKNSHVLVLCGSFERFLNGAHIAFFPFELFNHFLFIKHVNLLYRTERNCVICSRLNCKYTKVKIFRIVADFYLLAVVCNKGSAVLQNHFLCQVWANVLCSVQFDSVAFYLAQCAFHEKVSFITRIYKSRHPAVALVLFQFFFGCTAER